jgi:transcriptional regulator with XRE-family HTH domain
VPSKERLAYLGLRRGERLLREYAEEVRTARLASGLSQRAVASAIGLSKSTVSRIELCDPPIPDLVTAARLARIVGLDLSVRCFPTDGALRDAAHVALIRRFLGNVDQAITRRLEAPVRLPDDLRAWDVLLAVGGLRIGVAAETRIRDLQALLRREQAKARDDSVDVILLVIAATRANRRALREAEPLLTEEFPMDTRAVLRSLRRGEPPSGNGVVLV